MFPAEFSETQRAEVRRLAALAHERELTIAAAGLGESVDAWRAGEAGVFDLKQAVHLFQSGPAASLYRRYERGEPTAAVLYALHKGILTEAEIPGDLQDWARHALAPMRDPA